MGIRPCSRTSPGAYERGRPGYPEEAVRWLAGDEPRDVVDLGAGTGKLSRALVALGHRVMAVEPLPQMLEQLADNAPGAFGVLGSAEVIPLPDAFADVVTSAQSFHWFDHELALPEIARVLRPEGRLALVWNVRDDDDPFMARLSEVIGNERLADGAGYGPLEESDLFGRVESAVFHHEQVVGPGHAARPRPLAEPLREARARRPRPCPRGRRSPVRRGGRPGRGTAALRHALLPGGEGRLRRSVAMPMLERFPRVLLHAEGLAVLAGTLALYFDAGYGWLLLVLLALAPDLSMLGYLAGQRVGALSYDLVHTYVGPVALGVVGVLGDSDTSIQVALIWLAHIGADRLLGYGLKYPTGFKDTHLQRV